MSDQIPRRTGRRASLPAGAAVPAQPPVEPAAPTPVLERERVPAAADAPAAPVPDPVVPTPAAAPAAAAVDTPAAAVEAPAAAAIDTPAADTPERDTRVDDSPAANTVRPDVPDASADTERQATEPQAPEPQTAPRTTAPQATEPQATDSQADPEPAVVPPRRPRERRGPRTRTRTPRIRTPRPPRDRHQAARILLAAATVAALGGTVAASSLLPLARVDAQAVSTSVTPSAEGLRLGCAGPLLQLSEAAPGDSAAVTALNAPVRATGGSAAVRERALTATLQGMEARAFAVETAPDPAGATVLGSAAQSQYGSAGLVGLVASACAPPAGSSWLVGGSTQVGRTTLVNLLNPTDVTAVVDLTLIGGAGPVTPPGATGISVPAGEQVVVPLSGLAPDLAAPVLQVQSRGGQVVATLQQSIVRGIDAGGVDTFGATAAPAKRQIIPGVRVTNSAALTERMAAEGFADLQTVVRMHVPGDEHTEVRIGATADRTGGEGASLAFELEPGQVVDVPLGPLADGSYTVTLDSDLPIVAAVRQSQLTASGRTDFAWLVAAEPLRAGAETWLSITPGPSPGVYLHNPGESRVTGALTAVDGAAIPIEVEPGATLVVPVTPRQTYRLQADGELRGAVSYLGEGGIAGYPVLPAPAPAEPVTVYPG